MSNYARRIRPVVQAELDAASRAEAEGDAQGAFRHLERAHVLGQAATTHHVRVHWTMFRWALRHRAGREAVGQLWRGLGAALATHIGWVPTGNTGGANTSGLRRMPIPPDLQQAIDEASGRRPDES